MYAPAMSDAYVSTRLHRAGVPGFLVRIASNIVIFVDTIERLDTEIGDILVLVPCFIE